MRLFFVPSSSSHASTDPAYHASTDPSAHHASSSHYIANKVPYKLTHYHGKYLIGPKCLHILCTFVFTTKASFSLNTQPTSSPTLPGVCSDGPGRCSADDMSQCACSTSRRDLQEEPQSNIRRRLQSCSSTSCSSCNNGGQCNIDGCLWVDGQTGCVPAPTSSVSRSRYAFLLSPSPLIHMVST